MSSRVFVYCIIVIVTCCGLTFAQDAATANSIRDANFKAGLGQWVDAIEQYQRILETAGDDLVAVELPVAPLAQMVGGSAYNFPWTTNHFVPARWVCHEHLSRFPPVGLKFYRDRVDPSAAKRLEAARKRADDHLLEQLLADCFCSGAGEDAILLLAQRAFDRADFDGAERYWRMLLPKSLSPGSALRFPNPRTAPAAIQARLILARLFRGEIDAARAELSAYRRSYPTASGLLAGHDAKFADTLEALVRDPRQVTLPREGGAIKEWATFAGNSQRNSVVTGNLPRYWPGPPTWKTSITAEAPIRIRTDEPLSGSPEHPRSLAFHPIIAHGKAFVADAARIHSFDLMTGLRETIYDLRKTLPVPNLFLRVPVTSDVRHTLTYANGLLYARLGAVALRPPGQDTPREPGSPVDNTSILVCLKLADKHDSEPTTKPLWTMRPPNAAKDPSVMFEGTPVIDGDRLYVILWRQSGGDAITSIACYQGLGRRSLPELVWQRDAGRLPFNPNSKVGGQHDLVTLAGPNVVYCSNAGNIISLDNRTGKPVWEFRYQRNDRRPAPAGRELCPCLAYGGRIFAAPSDANRLLCLDAFSGQLLWDIDGVDVVHLLGVARGRLIATFAGQVKGIRGIDVATSSEIPPTGWMQHVDGGESTFGRGFVSPDFVFWPTKHGLQILDPVDGSSTRQPLPGMFGNLSYADGVFIVTTATEVWGFVTEGKFLERRRLDAPKEPPDKTSLYRLGVSEADAGNVEKAVAVFERVKSGVGSKELDEGAHEQAQRLRWTLAERYFTAGNWNTAASLYREIASRANGTSDPLSRMVSLRLAEINARQDSNGAGRRELEAFLTDSTLTNLDGHPRTIASLAKSILVNLSHQKPREPIKKPTSVNERPAANADSGVAIYNCTPPMRRTWELPVENGAYIEGSENEAINREQIALFLRGGRLLRFQTDNAAIKSEIASLQKHSDNDLHSSGRLVFWGDDCVGSVRSTHDWKWTLIRNQSNLGERHSLLSDKPFLPGRLSAFHCDKNRIYALYDDRLLLAINAENGKVLWEHWALSSAAIRGQDAVVISPNFHVGNGSIALQVSSGQMRILDAADGHVRHELPTGRLPWIQDPIAIDEHGIIFPDDGEKVTCVDLHSGRPRWSHRIWRSTSLVGNQVQLRQCGEILLIGATRNQGMEIDAIVTKSGQPFWAQALSIGNRPFLLASLGFNGKVLYVPTESGVTAISPATGKPMWDAAVPGVNSGEWNVRCGNSHLMMFPRRSVSMAHDDWERECARLVQTIPTLPRLWRFVDRSIEILVDRELPVLILERSTGKIVQRMTFPARGLSAEVRRSGNGIVVATGAGIWGLEAGTSKE